VDINSFLALFGGIIFLGFLGQYFFRKTKLPVPVILLLTGILLGFLNPLEEKSLLFTIAPYFGTFALLLILFEGGLELEFGDLLRQIRSALGIGFLYFFLCLAGVYGLGRWVLQLAPEYSLLLGLILAGSSPGVLIPTISQLSIPKEMKANLALETNFTELLTVVLSLMFIEFLDQGKGIPGTGEVLSHLASSIAVALLFAMVAGVLWSRFMGLFSREPLAYMLTLALLCALYSVTQWAGGKGSLAVLFFGVILGNAQWLATRSLGLIKKWSGVEMEREHFLMDEVIQKMNAELSFLVRTFFFVFLGFLFDFHAFHLRTGLMVAAVVSWFYLSRWMVCRSFYKKSNPFFSSVPLALHLAMVPRGLGNAVMAFLAMGLGIPGYDRVTTVVLGVILGTNLLMALFVYRSEKQSRSK
jgi:cell volume regulation protein A